MEPIKILISSLFSEPEKISGYSTALRDVVLINGTRITAGAKRILDEIDDVNWLSALKDKGYAVGYSQDGVFHVSDIICPTSDPKTWTSLLRR